MRQIVFAFLLVTSNQVLFGQNSLLSSPRSNEPDSINNLVLPAGYKTSELGGLPHFVERGKGKTALILIPGIGFDGSVYDDFISSNVRRYRMFSLTIPGYGNTASPPLPSNGTSYGQQIWNNGAVEGIRKLIQKEQMEKPVLIGHFTQGVQLAMQFAINYSDLIGGIILVGGPSKFIAVQNGKAMEYSYDFQVKAIDTYMAPKFYKTIKKDVFDENNYLAEIYSVQTELAAELWARPTRVMLPVMIQYLCEFFASDLTEEVPKITVPILIVRPGFPDKLLNQPNIPTVNYIRPQFISGWEKVKERNPQVEIADVTNSGVFIWKDQPKEFNRLVSRFIKHVKR